jgi:glucose-1-phosphate thymidylyltransferase
LTSIHRNQNETFEQEVIGLIPAAGQANRLSPLPCSKELFPIGFETIDRDHNLIPKVVCHYLLEKMRLAGIANAYIVIREGKWDIPAYLGDGSMLAMNLAYLMMGLPFGVPYTIDQAYSFVKDKIIALGFPDIIFESNEAFTQVLHKLESTNADVVVGIFPADLPHKVDMLELGNDCQIKRFVIKPQKTHLRYTWGLAVWTPVFTRFMHEYLVTTRDSAENTPELFIGDVIQAAINDGLQVEGVKVSDEPYVDIGTGDDLLRVIKCFLENHSVS